MCPPPPPAVRPSTYQPLPRLALGHDVAMLVSEGEMQPHHMALLAMDRLPVLSTTWWQALVAVAAILFPGMGPRPSTCPTGSASLLPQASFEHEKSLGEGRGNLPPPPHPSPFHSWDQCEIPLCLEMEGKRRRRRRGGFLLPFSWLKRIPVPP